MKKTTITVEEHMASIEKQGLAKSELQRAVYHLGLAHAECAKDSKTAKLLTGMIENLDTEIGKMEAGIKKMKNHKL